MAHFTKSRNCNPVVVETSCEGTKIKCSKHLDEDEAGHSLPLWAIKDALDDPTESTVQDTGRTKNKSKDGYEVVVSAQQTDSYIPVVTGWKTSKKK